MLGLLSLCWTGILVHIYICISRQPHGVTNSTVIEWDMVECSIDSRMQRVQCINMVNAVVECSGRFEV